MSTAVPRSSPGRTLLPYRHLQWRSMAVGNAALVVPGLLVALVLAAWAGGHIGPALVLLGLLVLASAGGAVVALRARTELTPDGLVSVFTHLRPTVRVRKEDVEQAVVRVVHNTDGLTTNRHLVLVDRDGRGLFRMCDRWWRAADLTAVAHHFQVPLVAQPEPVQPAELRRSVPGQLTWAENHRIGVALVKVAGGFGVCLVVAALCVASL